MKEEIRKLIEILHRTSVDKWSIVLEKAIKRAKEEERERIIKIIHNTFGDKRPIETILQKLKESQCDRYGRKSKIFSRTPLGNVQKGEK